MLLSKVATYLYHDTRNQFNLCIYRRYIRMKKLNLLVFSFLVVLFPNTLGFSKLKLLRISFINILSAAFNDK